MLKGVLSEGLVERMVERYLPQWNRLSVDQLVGLRETPLDGCPGVLLSWISKGEFPYGYRYLRFQLERPGQFTVELTIEGEPGQLSTRTHHPIAKVEGDAHAAAAWLELVAQDSQGS